MIRPKRKLFTLCIAFILTLSTVYASGGDTTPYNWYVRKTQDHTAPTLPQEFTFIEDLNSYYCDTAKDKNDKVIYLTFDAGYENGNTAKILDALQKHGAKGTFFVLENIIRREPDLIKRMIAEGHTVANHTGRHPDMTKITDKADFAKQLSSLEDVYRECTGEEMVKLYRPPQGRFSAQNLEYAKELGYATVFWSFAYADWDNAKQPDPASSMEKILAHTHNGMIILLHPTSATNAQIMDDLLSAWESEGYRFGDLEELCGI